MSIPVVIINGPLGSGKTTLIHEFLGHVGDPTEVLWLKTEFGEQSIDNYLLADTGVQTDALVGGCICHVLLTDLDRALRDMDISGISLLLIETSGMSHPQPVVSVIRQHAAFELAHVALIIDAMHAHEPSYPKPMPLPVGFAVPYDVMLINKYPQHATPVQEGELEQVLDPWYTGVYDQVEKIRLPNIEEQQAYADAVAMWATPLVATLAEHRSLPFSDVSISHHQAEDHEGDLEVRTYEFSEDQIVPKEIIDAFTMQVPETIVRIKGMVQYAPGSYGYINWARGTGRWQALAGKPISCQLIIMGTQIPSSIFDLFL
jgi:G3E family GTPase